MKSFSKVFVSVEKHKDFIVCAKDTFSLDEAHLKVKKLSQEDILSCQRRGYFDEHLVAFYASAYGAPYLYKDTYLLYHDELSGTLWITLFGLLSKEEDRICCLQASIEQFNPQKVIVTSPEKLPMYLGGYHCETVFFDKDYQINLLEFDDGLRGGAYKGLRYRVNNARKRGYTSNLGKAVTPAHAHLMALHLTKRSYALWDYQLFMKIDEYVEKYSSPRVFNAFENAKLVGFDIVDALKDVLAIPMGFCLDCPSLADFLIYQEILYAKSGGFKWLDIGWACNPGLEEFKKKWMATPRFHVGVQEYRKVS